MNIQYSEDGKILLRAEDVEGKFSIPYSVEEICIFAFQDCKDLTYIEIPNSVKRIGYAAFRGCTGLSSIEIPNSVVEIEDWAFAGCENIESFDVPDSLTTIGKHVFDGCDKLSVFHVCDDNKAFITNNGVLYNIDITEIIAYPPNLNREQYSIPETVIRINECAFSQAKRLTRMLIPSSVKEIGEYAFEGCSSLYSIELPNSLSEIKQSTFQDCESLNSVNIPDSVIKICESAFSGCSNLRELYLGNHLEEIGDYAFQYCDKIDEVVLPNSLKHIGRFAFDIQKKVTITNKDLFIDDDGLGHNTWDVIVQIPVNNIYAMNCFKVLEKYDHIFPGLEERTLEQRLSGDNLGKYYFTRMDDYGSYYRDYNKPGLYSGDMECFIELYYEYFTSKPITKFVVDERVKYICNGAFIQRSGFYSLITTSDLKDLQLPDSLVAIGNNAFECCGITTIDLPQKLEYIGDFAFKESNLNGVFTIPKNVSHIGINPFAHTKICQIETKSSSFIVKESVLYTSDLKRLIYCFSPQSEINIPMGVETIDDFAFSHCIALKITLPPSVKEIGKSAFQGCYQLKDIILCNLNLIRESCFDGCQNLTSLNIPEPVSKIESFAFSGCRNLSKVTIPDSVTDIDSHAFCYCDSLKIIEISDKLLKFGNGAFTGCSGLSSFTVKNGNPNYCSVDGVLYNKSKTEVVAFPAGKKITDFIIPAFVCRISEYSFANCKRLTSVTIPTTVTEICRFAFAYCENLVEIHCHIKNLAEINIDKFAFEKCRLSKCVLYVPIGTGYSYRHHPIFSKCKEVIIEK